MSKRLLTKDQRGQAMAEMLICLPILFLFLVGLVQFSILLAARVQFEHSCGEAARQYCAGLVDKDSLGPSIYKNMGYFQKYFDYNSLTVTTQQPQSTADSKMDEVRNAIRFIPFTINYDGCEWAIDINCTPPFFFEIVFPNGIAFHTIMQVYRYPA
jgi:hypothetical protein